MHQTHQTHKEASSTAIEVNVVAPRSDDRVEWDEKEIIVTNGMCLVDYFLTDKVTDMFFDMDMKSGRLTPGMFGYASLSCIIRHRQRLEEQKWSHDSFEELVARLAAVSKQNLWDQCDKFKIGFIAHGRFRGHWFTLYDYKADRAIHIGASHLKQDRGGENSENAETDKWLNDLKVDLVKQLSTATPQPFKAKNPYDKRPWSYPCIAAAKPNKKQKKISKKRRSKSASATNPRSSKKSKTVVVASETK
jgi:hypothetical protein